MTEIVLPSNNSFISQELFHGTAVHFTFGSESHGSHSVRGRWTLKLIHPRTNSGYIHPAAATSPNSPLLHLPVWSLGVLTGGMWSTYNVKFTFDDKNFMLVRDVNFYRPDSDGSCDCESPDLTDWHPHSNDALRRITEQDRLIRPSAAMLEALHPQLAGLAELLDTDTAKSIERGAWVKHADYIATSVERARMDLSQLMTKSAAAHELAAATSGALTPGELREQQLIDFDMAQALSDVH